MIRIRIIAGLLLFCFLLSAQATLDYFGDIRANTLDITISYADRMVEPSKGSNDQTATAGIIMTNGIPWLDIPRLKIHERGTVTIVMYDGITKANPKKLAPHGKIIFTFRKSAGFPGSFYTYIFEVPFTINPDDTKAMLALGSEGQAEMREESALSEVASFGQSPEPSRSKITVNKSTLGLNNKLTNTH